jgi:hypothetical protein
MPRNYKTQSSYSCPADKSKLTTITKTWRLANKQRKKYRCALYLRVIRSKIYCGYVKPRIITNAVYNVINT